MTAATISTAVVLLVWVVLLAFEARHFAGKRRVLRLLIVTLLAASLWMLIVRPTWTRSVRIEEAILITPGSTDEHVSAARRAAGDRSPVFAVNTDPARDATPIPDLAYLARHYPDLRRLHVAGHGLPAWDWDRLEATLELAGSATPADGFDHIDWPREIAIGEPWIVRGRLTRAPSPGGSLRLRGPGGQAARFELPPTDSAVSSPGFELMVTPPRKGRHLYHLEMMSPDGAPLVEETLDVVVREPESVTILWLEGAPRFETGHFKRWLVRRGDGLVVRQTISRDRTRVERHNHPRVDAGRLTAELLDRFDLLVLDGRTIATLVRSERETLTRAVAGGLGVLVLPDDGKSSGAELTLLTRWPTRPIEGLDRFAAKPRFPGRGTAAPLEIAPREIVLGDGVTPLLLDDSGYVLAASRLYGSGTVGFSLLADSFRWALEGHEGDHGSYWSHMIGHLSRRRPDPRWRTASGPVFVDDPLTLTLETDGSQPACLVFDEDSERDEPLRLAPRQDPLEPQRWQATLWPRRVGWHTVETGGGVTAIYVQARAAWPAWQQVRNLTSTTRRSVIGRRRGAPPAAASTQIPVRVPDFVLFGLFLGCLTVLWIDERRGEAGRRSVPR